MRRVKLGDGTSVTVAPGRNHLKQRRSVSIALFLTQNRFVASGIEIDLPNPAIASRLQSHALAGRVAALGSLGVLVF